MNQAPTQELYKMLGEEGVLASQIGPGPWLKGLKLPGGIKPEEFDYFHEVSNNKGWRIHAVSLTSTTHVDDCS